MRGRDRGMDRITREPLSASERRFLLEHTDLTEAELSQEGRAATYRSVIEGRLDARAAMEARPLSTSEVVEILRCT